WNAPSVFPAPADWEAEYKSLSESLPDLAKYQGHLGDSAKTLADGLEAIQDFYRRVGKVAVYAGMAYSVDTTDQAAAGMDGRSDGLFARFLAARAFADPEILAIGQEKLNNWITQDDRLAIYKFYFDSLFRLQQHVRSPEVEEVLGMAADPFSSVRNTASMLTNADLKFQPA